MKPNRKAGTWTKRLVLLAVGAAPLITTATCDPYTGALLFFRDDDYDVYVHDHVFYDEFVIYEDCFFDCWW